MSSSTPPPTPAMTTATSPAHIHKGKDIAFACSSPGKLDVYVVSPPSSPAKGNGKGKLRREEEAAGNLWGMSEEALRRDVEEMSDRELQREIEGIPTFGLFLTPEKRERRQRFLHLLEKEARRRGFRFGHSQDIEDEQMEHACRKYIQKPSSIRPMKNYGQLGVQTPRRPRKPIVVDSLYSSKTSPTALYGNTLRVRPVDQKENDNEKSRHNYMNFANRAHRDYNLDPAMEERSSAKKGAKGSGEPTGCCIGSLQKKARTTSKCNPEHEEEDEICNVFTHEMDNLECDICYLPFESQVYSCKNGHAVCASCCINMERKCPSCKESIGDFRCRAMEKILAGMTRPCRFKKHGCLETVRYTETRLHEEELCRYAPCRCPFDGCAYSGRLLYGHIQDAHDPGTTSALFGPMTITLKKCEPFRVLLHSDGESIFLLLNCCDLLTGHSLALVGVCPYPVEEDPKGVEAMYTIAVKGDGQGLPLLSVSGKVQFVRRLEGDNAKGFLFVPEPFWGSSDSVTVTVYL